MNKITIEFHKNTIDPNAQNKLSPMGYALYRAFCYKLNTTTSTEFAFTFNGYRHLADAVNFTADAVQEAVKELTNVGYLAKRPIEGYENSLCYKFYQDGRVPSQVKVPEGYRDTLPWLYTPLEDLKLLKNSYHPDVDNYNVF